MEGRDEQYGKPEKYGKPENYLFLVEDNIHTVGSGSETAGKVKEKFLGEGIKYNDTKCFLLFCSQMYKNEK